MTFTSISNTMGMTCTMQLALGSPLEKRQDRAQGYHSILEVLVSFRPPLLSL
jgi:hypothetical protein